MYNENFLSLTSIELIRRLCTTGKEKLGSSKEQEVQIITEDDGTEVEADTFAEFPPATVFLFKSASVDSLQQSGEDTAGSKTTLKGVVLT